MSTEGTNYNMFYVARVALIVALGGFLMGFDASVISGVVGFIDVEFNLNEVQKGFAVACLTFSAAFAMLVAGPLSDRLSRRKVLYIAALLYAVSAIGSALAPNYITLVIARMIGGLGVGASLIIAPMYIAEISPASARGKMVSFNQLNIVIGISVAFFTNYLILQLSKSDVSWAQSFGFDQYTWRWMLGLETLPALLYFVALNFVPRSPRWLIMNEQYDDALAVMKKAVNEDYAFHEMEDIKSSIASDKERNKPKLSELFSPAMKFVLTIGIVVAILQQITGINSVFFYAPMIFEQSGIGTDASFVQAILVGLINLVFTIIAIIFIDRIGRKPLLVGGVAGIVICMFLLAYGFNSATYTLSSEALASLPAEIDKSQLTALVDTTFENDIDFKNSLQTALGSEAAKVFESKIITAAISMKPMLILFGILGFVASFAISVGPVMWVLLSELFPNRLRGLAISFVGFINSAVSFLVQLVFPWELANFGSALTFLIYGIFAVIGLVFVIMVVPETKGKSLEELETMLIK
ncbi:MAG: sugar porter family MFS transporter [Bacteroidota bacterium]